MRVFLSKDKIFKTLTFKIEYKLPPFSPDFDLFNMSDFEEFYICFYTLIYFEYVENYFKITYEYI